MGASRRGHQQWFKYLGGPVLIGDSTARIGTEDGGNITVSGSIGDSGFNFPLVIRQG